MSSSGSRNALSVSSVAFTLIAALAGLGAASAQGCGGKSRATTPLSFTFNLTSSGSLPANSAIASIAIFGERSGIALMNSSGAPRTEVLIPFDPLTGAVSPSATARQVVTFSPALQNRSGQPVSTTVTSFPAFAAAASGKLYVTMSNLNSSFVYNPGVVLVYDYAVQTNQIGAFRQAIATTVGAQTLYNPTAIVPFTRAGGTTRLAVVCGDDAFANDPKAAVVVIDPATDSITESVMLGDTAGGSGEVALGPDLRLYVGSASRAEIYVVNLLSTPAVLERGATGSTVPSPVTLTTAQATFNNISDLEVSADGSQLLALNSNDGSLTALSLASPASPTALTRTLAFKRSTPTSAFDSMPFTMALRAGRPGVDFAGADLIVGTIGIRTTGDQVVVGIQTAIDAVTTYPGSPSVSLNALVSPFTVSTDIQHVVAPSAGALAGSFFAVEGTTGKVVVRTFDALP